ncbi:CBS domain-containing protein [Microbispora sp. NEAU-D428]|uniref:CBS domain-containing protein n=1 Tax=Microbispora sitophila TaxID=2771537 RepID=UPI00186670ED|nr:CBS domain-containing protein [Microbispora sitophila]MBE3011206.1 CBS domain-containing protein [Microbispora sitophila]
MHMKVRDVMTSEVASVNGSTPFRDVAEVLIAHEVSAVPVVDGEGHVVGVVSEADLLRKEEFREQFYREGYRPPLRARLREAVGHGAARSQARARGVTAAELMSTPAVTTRPYTSVVSAARQMSQHGVKRLPVVDDEGVLVGIISRHDLLKVLARADADIAHEVREDIIGNCLWADLSGVEVSVSEGVVTLTGALERRSQARVLTRMVERTNGVIGVVDRLEWKEDDVGPWEGA